MSAIGVTATVTRSFDRAADFSAPSVSGRGLQALKSSAASVALKSRCLVDMAVSLPGLFLCLKCSEAPDQDLTGPLTVGRPACFQALMPPSR